MRLFVYTQVLYVPDQDELAKLAPPTVVAEPPVTSSIGSASADSETTPTITAVEDREGRGEDPEVDADGMKASPQPSQATADEYISILSKYISEDQVCYSAISPKLSQIVNFLISHVDWFTNLLCVCLRAVSMVTWL